jgi:hypothetical protein
MFVRSPIAGISVRVAPSILALWYVSCSTKRTVAVLASVLGVNLCRLDPFLIMCCSEVCFRSLISPHVPLDYDLLEDSTTALYRCRPTAKPDHLRKRDKLKSECYQRGTHLKLFPHVFELARCNSSTLRNRKEEGSDVVNQEILWRIEWKFDNNVVLTDTCVSETKTLRELLSRFFDNSWKLGPTRHMFPNEWTDLDQFEIYLNDFKNNKIILNLDSTIMENFRDKCFIEFPHLLLQYKTAS